MRKLIAIILLFNLGLYCFETEKIKIRKNNKEIDVDVVKNQVIVEIDESKKTDIINRLKSKGYDEIIKIYKNFYLAYGKNVPDVSMAMSLLSNDNIKTYPNRVFKLFYVPNDQDFSKQWYLNKVNAPMAWDFEENKATVTVIVVDSGIDGNHKDLKDILYSTQVVVTQTGLTLSITKEYLPNFSYSENHGTMVSGVIGAIRDNSEGISGVARSSSTYNYGIKIYSVNVFRNGIDEYGLAKTLEYIKNNISSDYFGNIVINMSLGSAGECAPLLDSVITDMFYSTGTKFIFVAAAGNDNGPVSSPANCRNVVPVSATNEFDNLASFSNYGPEMKNGVCAPGTNIFTTLPGSIYSDKESGYPINGTSFSAPIVSGIMASLWAKRPDLKNYQVIDLVKKTSNDINNDGPDEKYGWGRVDMYKLFSYIEGDLSPKNINKFTAWPNPFYISKHRYIKFSVSYSGIYPDDKLMIYDFNGSFVAYATKDGVGGFIWDGKNASGSVVSPGVYVAYYKSEKGHYKTKFLLFR